MEKKNLVICLEPYSKNEIVAWAIDDDGEKETLDVGAVQMIRVLKNPAGGGRDFANAQIEFDYKSDDGDPRTNRARVTFGAGQLDALIEALKIANDML